MEITLKKLLKQYGQEAELASMHKYPDKEWRPNLSTVHSVSTKLDILIDLLDEVIEVDQTDENSFDVTLKKVRPEEIAVYTGVNPKISNNELHIDTTPL